MKRFYMLRTGEMGVERLLFLRSKRRFCKPLAYVLIIRFFVKLVLIGEPALAQSKEISHAYQVTHADIATPSLSPDGKRTVFEQVIDGKEQLFAIDLDGSNSVQLTHGPCGHENPAWSPDGQKLAVVSDEGDQQVIYI